MQTISLAVASILLALAGAGSSPANGQDKRIAVGAAAVQAFARHCYTPNEQGGRAVEPAASDGWQAVPEALRARFGIADEPGLKAWLRPGTRPEDALLLQIHERRLDKAGVHSRQMRISCRVVAVSEELETGDLHEALAQLIGSPAGSTHRDVLENLGYPTPEGWAQACWTILTRIENTEWQAWKNENGPACVWLTSPRNYTVSQYIVVRLLTRNSGGTAILEFDRTVRPDALED